MLLKVQGILPHYRSGAIKAVYDAAKHRYALTYQPLIGWRRCPLQPTILPGRRSARRTRAQR